MTQNTGLRAPIETAVNVVADWRGGARQDWEIRFPLWLTML
jgi:hypothetical protein